MCKYAVIGAGISGLTTAHLLQDKGNIVNIYERDSEPGGLIKCRRVNGSLFHTCGGHVFNSKRKDVLDWFWTQFSREDEFDKTNRNASVFIDKNGLSLEYDTVPYPIEDHMYYLDEKIQKSFYSDLDEIDSIKGENPQIADYKSFGDFLRWRFGKTLYNLYFKPYNEKIWQCDLNSISMAWIDGKLPMPTTQEMRNNNANKIDEEVTVHSSFWYEKNGGSQYIADKLAKGLSIKFSVNVDSLLYKNGKWIVCGEEYDRVVFCGNIKEMIKMIKGVNLEKFGYAVETLKYHGTTATFCVVDKNPYSWIYQPSHFHSSHRIICTGNFASTNNDANLSQERVTATVEFTGELSYEAILDNLRKIPLNPQYLDHVYNKYAYPIQDENTRGMIKELKAILAIYGFYFTGRFADWEYYNMDASIGAAIDLIKNI